MNNAIIGKSQTKTRHGGYKAGYKTNDKPRPGKRNIKPWGKGSRQVTRREKRYPVWSWRLSKCECVLQQHRHSSDHHELGGSSLRETPGAARWESWTRAKTRTARGRRGRRSVSSGRRVGTRLGQRRRSNRGSTTTRRSRVSWWSRGSWWSVIGIRSSAGVLFTVDYTVPFEIVALEQHLACSALETFGMEAPSFRATAVALHGLEVLALDTVVASRA